MRFENKFTTKILKKDEVAGPEFDNGSVRNQRRAYNIPSSLVGTNANNTQMVWGPGTFGISKDDLEIFFEYYCSSCKLSNVQYDTQNHGESGGVTGLNIFET